MRLMYDSSELNLVLIGSIYGNAVSLQLVINQFMNILILGSGGREHTFAWKLRQSKRCDQLFVAPVDMLIVGPEVPLVAGITDYFMEHMPGLKVLGPNKAAAQLEGSKAFAKQFMKDNNIPTAGYLEVTANNLQEGIEHIQATPGPYVLKADGLAAGKGVLIIKDKTEAKSELAEMIEGKFGGASSKVVIEDFLDGIEFSVFVLTDGKYYTLFPEAKDYKRIGEGDAGLNTGGMGAVSPVPFCDVDMMHKVRERIILPTLSGLEKRNMEYVGFIFFGLIVVDGEPQVIEYNCRMGDPETEVVLPRIQNDIVDLFEAVFEKGLYEIPLEKDPRTAATVMMVSGGYPEQYEKGKLIKIGDINDSIIFHAGTKLQDQEVITNGGRVIAVTSLAEDMKSAIANSLANVEQITFEGSYHRKDIGFDL